MANQTETIAQQLDYQLEVGLGYESDALLAQSNVHHLKVKMLGAKSEFGQKTVILVRLLNLDPKTKLVSMDSVISPLDLPTNFKIIEFENAHLQTHPKYLAGNIKLESLKTEKKTATLGLLLPEFRIGAYGSYFGDLNDPVSPMVPSQFPETNQLYSTSEVNASLLWRIPLGNLVYGGDVKTFNSKINLQQLENEQIETEINADVLMAKERLAAAKEQIELAFEGNQLAEKAMQQSLQRQALKTIRPFELLQTQQVFIQSRLDYLEAISAFNKAQFALRVAKGERL